MGHKSPPAPSWGGGGSPGELFVTVPFPNIQKQARDMVGHVPSSLYIKVKKQVFYLFTADWLVLDLEIMKHSFQIVVKYV